MTKPKKIGRPPLGANARKQVPVRMSDDERRRFQKAAKQEGQELGPWLRGLAHGRCRSLGV